MAAVDVVDGRLDDDGVVAAKVLVPVAFEAEDRFRLDEVERQFDSVVGLKRRALKRRTNIANRYFRFGCFSNTERTPLASAAAVAAQTITNKRDRIPKQV